MTVQFISIAAIIPDARGALLTISREPVPGRHRFSGDRNKAETIALFEEVVPEFSETGEPVISTFSIEVEGVVATDEWVFTRARWNHSRYGKCFDQHGVEMYRMNAEGQIAEFWALMRDTAAFDEFVA